MFINLRHSKITDENLVLVMVKIINMTTDKTDIYIDLSDNDITTKSGLFIQNILLERTNIKYVRITSNPLSNGSIEEFVNQLPEKLLKKLIWVNKHNIDGGSWICLVKKEDNKNLVRKIHNKFYQQHAVSICNSNNDTEEYVDTCKEFYVCNKCKYASLLLEVVQNNCKLQHDCISISPCNEYTRLSVKQIQKANNIPIDTDNHKNYYYHDSDDNIEFNKLLQVFYSRYLDSVFIDPDQLLRVKVQLGLLSSQDLLEMVLLYRKELKLSS